MEGHEDIQNQLKNLTSKTAHIERMLGRGSKTIVLQFGSHSLKYGIANDSSPQSVRCVVARKIRGLVEAPHAMNSEVDSKRLAEVGKHIENFLTKKGNIKRGDPLNKGLKPKPMKLEPIREKFEFSEKPSDFGGDVYVGEEVYFLEGRRDYRIREPLVAGCLNTSLEYTFRDAISDLELVVRHALGMMNVPSSEIDQYSVVLCAPDKFHRAQYKLILDMLMGNIGFGGFCIHVESVLASFGSGLSLACVVDIGATSITVTTVDEGIIVPNSQVKKTYGVRDLDILLWNMLTEKGGISIIPDNGCTLSMQKYKHLAAIEKIREKYGILEIIEDQMKIADIILPSELNEPTKVAVPICSSFIVAPALFFHFEGLDTLAKPGAAGSVGAKPIPDRAAELADGILIEEEENPDDFEAKLNRQLNQITAEEQLRLNSVLEQVGLNLSRLQSETMPCNLEEIICYSICQLKDTEARKKAANAIVVTGGFSRTKFLVEELEDRLIERISRYDSNIERVEVIDYSKKEFDNADMVWIGGSILPKVDCMRDGFVSRNRWLGKIDHEEEKDRRWRKDCPEFGLKYLKEKLAFQW